jgi:hypothetical protein
MVLGWMRKYIRYDLRIKNIFDINLEDINIIIGDIDGCLI